MKSAADIQQCPDLPFSPECPFFQRVKFQSDLFSFCALFLLKDDHDLAALVRQWHSEGRTVISVLHDFEHVRQEYPETLMLARDAIAYGKTAEVLSEENLLRARRLAEAQGDFSHAPVCHAD